MRHHGFIRASALTYTTLLAIVPLLILISVIASNFGLLDLATETLPKLNEVLSLSLPMDSILPILTNAQKIELRSLGIFGSLGLLFTFIMAMSNLEGNLNVVWRVFTTRSILRTVLVFTPFLLFFALLLVFLSLGFSHIREWSEHFLKSGALDGRFSDLANANLPVIFFNGWFGCFLFVLYWIIPYTRVYPWVALASTIVVLVLLQLFFVGFVYLQAGMFARFNLLYGSLGFIPLILVLVYCAWALVLAGNCLSYALQNWKILDASTLPMPEFIRKKFFDKLRTKTGTKTRAQQKRRR